MFENPIDLDQRIAETQVGETRVHRGRLRIFFGATAGVGKTYSMLEAARVLHTAGIDVMIGYIEPHARADAQRLANGITKLPTLAVSCGPQRDYVRQEFDLDEALRRRPNILLVDALAHSNAVDGVPVPRHLKRWQDVEELLDAGINVWTTLNIQHLESLNDVVEQSTGVRQRDTLPDRIFDGADEIELVDLPPNDLLARLHAGKVFVAKEVGAATDRFFSKPNLIAMRELALRKATARVQAASRAPPTADQTSRVWLARDRLLVAVGPGRQAEQLVRAGKRMSDALDGEWTVVYIETPALLRLSDVERNRRIDVLRLAESLGAETVTLDGPTVANALAEYAQTRHATRLIVGAPGRRGLHALFRGSTVTKLVRRKRDFDVITIAARDRLPSTLELSHNIASPQSVPQVHWQRYAWAVIISAICTAIGWVMYSNFEPANVVMVYLLGVTLAGIWLGSGPSIVAAILNVSLFDFCFVPPRFTFAMEDAQYLVTFGVMATIGLVIATLMASVRQQTRVAGARERRSALLYAMSRELTVTRDLPAIARVAVKHVAEVFQCQAVILFPVEGVGLNYPSEPAIVDSYLGSDLTIAQWVVNNGRRAGLGSDTLATAPALYLPLVAGSQTLGVLVVFPNHRRRVMLPEQLHLLETFAGQTALAVERVRLANEAESSRVAVESERLRNTLLASISHDLRTPLAVISGAGSTLADRGETLDQTTRISLARSIDIKAREVSELVSNVLDLVRLESGRLKLRSDCEGLDDLVGAALHSREDRLVSHPVELCFQQDLPPVYVDATLVVQVLCNLFDNIVKYTPNDARICIAARAEGAMVRVTVDDNGPGLPIGNPAQYFEKFQRGHKEDTVVGVGLGLAICRAIVRAHGGTIEARNRPGGGAQFEFTLPVAASQA